MKYILGLLLSFNIVCSFAQDPLFSQVYTNRMALNPAYVGNDNGYRGTIGHREQWTAVPSRFHNTSLGLEAGIPAIGAGAGLLINRSSEGEGRLTYTGLGLQFSKVIGIKDWKDEKLYLYFGGAASANYKAIDWDKLVFSDQLDPVMGKQFPTSATPPASENTFYPDFDGGIMLKYRRKSTGHTLGFAVHHIAVPDESFYGDGSVTLPRRYTLHYIFNFPLAQIVSNVSDEIYLGPGFVYQRQSSFQNMIIGSKISYRTLYGGAWYRSRFISVNERKMDGLILLVGNKFKLNNDTYLSFGYSYDLTLSGLRAQTAGTHELSLVIEYTAAAKRARSKYNRCRDFRSPAEKSMPVFDW